jgi:hypothetical protein
MDLPTSDAAQDTARYALAARYDAIVRIAFKRAIFGFGRVTMPLSRNIGQG